MQIIFTIPDEKVTRVVDAICGLFPIPTDTNGNPLFTPAQWAKEKIRRFIIDIVFRYEQKKAKDEAGNLITRDDTLAN